MGVVHQGLSNKPRQPKPISESRKIRKPLMERKRRERINSCLNELATLLTEARLVKSDGGKGVKLEKADILELTVKHLHFLRRGSGGGATTFGAECGGEYTKYKEGFSKCMKVVENALKTSETNGLRDRVLDHLNSCLKTLTLPTGNESVNGEKYDKSESDLSRDDDKKPSDFPDTQSSTHLTLFPTKLSDGGVVFVIKGDPNILLQGNLKSADYSNSSTQTNSAPTTNTACEESFVIQSLHETSQDTLLSSTLPSSSSPSTCHNGFHVIPSCAPIQTNSKPVSLNQQRHYAPETLVSYQLSYSPPLNMVLSEPSICELAQLPIESHRAICEEFIDSFKDEPCDLSIKKMWRPW